MRVATRMAYSQASNPMNEFDLDKGQWGAVEALFRAEGYEVDRVQMHRIIRAEEFRVTLKRYCQ
jgi:hypothetical protein